MTSVIRLSGIVEEKRAPQPIADAVSALINLGYGTTQNLFPRLPRLDFDEAAKIL